MIDLLTLMFTIIGSIRFSPRFLKLINYYYFIFLFTDRHREEHRDADGQPESGPHFAQFPAGGLHLFFILQVVAVGRLQRH
jgi:hypothetical protein